MLIKKTTQPNELQKEKHHIKKALAVLLGCTALLVLAHCSKQDKNSSATLVSQNEKKVSANVAAGARTMGCSCQEMSTKITGQEAMQLATEYAPIVYFDRSAPDYPTSVEDIWNCTDSSSITCGGTLKLVNNDAPRSLNFPTYVEVTADPNNSNRIFVAYWLLYKRQGNCVGSSGGHDYDLEHIVVQGYRDTKKFISITYFQHAGWYTRDWRALPASYHPFAYVGKHAHGMYDISRSTSFLGYECTYWGDYRNPASSADEAHTWDNLSLMSCDITQFNFDGNWGQPGQGPLYRRRDYWNFTSCNGTGGELSSADGCKRSDFPHDMLLGAIQ